MLRQALGTLRFGLGGGGGGIRGEVKERRKEGRKEGRKEEVGDKEHRKLIGE